MNIFSYPCSFNLRKLLWVLLLTCCGIIAPTLAAEEKISFGMFPAVSPVMLEERFGPLTKEFENLLGKEVVFRTKSMSEDFYRLLGEGEYDIAVVHRFNYVAIDALTTSYRPLLMRNEKGRGVVVVSGDNETSQIHELKNKVIAIPSGHSPVGLFAEYMFKEAGLNKGEYTFVYLNDHNSCLLAVVNKKVDACATAQKLFDFISKKRGYDLKAVASSIEVPGLFIVTHKRIDHLRDKFLQGLLEFSQTPKGNEVLNKAFLGDLVEIGPNDFVEVDKIITELRK